GGCPRSGDGTLLCPAQLPGAPHTLATNGLIGINSILLKRVHASQHFQNTQVMVNPAGTEKMSEVIFRFVEPFKDDDGLVSKGMLEIAIIIWNASFMPKDMQRKALEDVVNVLPSDDSEARRDMFFMVNMLL